MTAGYYCKSNGITLKEISEQTGVSRQTLLNWYRNKNKLFEIVVNGVLNGIKS